MYVVAFIVDGGMGLLLRVLGKFGFGCVLWFVCLLHMSPYVS